MKTEQLTKDKALEALTAIAEDITLLAIGEWTPDDDSCECTLDNIALIREYVAATKEN